MCCISFCDLAKYPFAFYLSLLQEDQILLRNLPEGPTGLEICVRNRQATLKILSLDFGMPAFSYGRFISAKPQDNLHAQRHRCSLSWLTLILLGHCLILQPGFLGHDCLINSDRPWLVSSENQASDYKHLNAHLARSALVVWTIYLGICRFEVVLRFSCNYARLHDTRGQHLFESPENLSLN